MAMNDYDVEVMEYTHYSLAYAGNADAGKAVIKKTLNYFTYVKNTSFDFIACAGNSGLALGSVLSYLMDKPMWHMRNSVATRLTSPNEKAEDVVKRLMSCNQYKGNGSIITLKDATYLFIDDLIDQGKTFGRVYNALKPKGAICKYISVNYGRILEKDTPNPSPIYIQ